MRGRVIWNKEKQIGWVLSDGEIDASSGLKLLVIEIRRAEEDGLNGLYDGWMNRSM